MSKITRFSNIPEKKRHASQYAHGSFALSGLNPSEDVIPAITNALNRPKIKIVAATGDKFNTYKTRIT
jgi:hypothetical protein